MIGVKINEVQWGSSNCSKDVSIQYCKLEWIFLHCIVKFWKNRVQKGVQYEEIQTFLVINEKVKYDFAPDPFQTVIT